MAHTAIVDALTQSGTDHASTSSYIFHFYRMHSWKIVILQLKLFFFRKTEGGIREDQD